MRKLLLILTILHLLSAVPLHAQETPICPQNEQYYRRWELLLNAQLPLGNAWNFTEIAVSPNGEFIAVATNTALSIHDAETLSETSRLEIGTSGFVQHLGMGWLPNSDNLLAAYYVYPSSSNTFSGVRIWNVQESRILSEFLIPTSKVIWSPQGSVAATRDSNGNLWLWDIYRGMTFQFHERISENAPFGSLLAWSPDTRLLAATTNDMLEIHTFAAPPRLIESPDNLVSTASWSADSTQIAIGNPINSRIHLFDITPGELLRTLRGSTGAPFDVRWSPDGRTIARATSTGFFLWDLSSDDQQPSRSFVEDVPPFMRMEWSPDSRYVYSVDLDGSVYKWDIESGCVVAAALTDWSTISWLQ